LIFFFLLFFFLENNSNFTHRSLADSKVREATKGISRANLTKQSDNKPQSQVNSETSISQWRK